ncbi:MAG: hypothetical protein LUF78_04970 [Clostridiales bacterium]|nr:hypothetical protein [Clostridiales bacterium]
MRKKQLFALLLAGVLALGMAPASAFAAEDADVSAEAVSLDDGTSAETEQDTEDTGETSGTEETGVAQESSAAETIESEETSDSTTETVETEAASETDTGETADTVVTTLAELQAAINAAPDVADITTAEPTTILISGTIALTDAVTIPAGKSIALAGDSADSSIIRSDSYVNDMFLVSGALYFAVSAEDSGSALSVYGSLSDGSTAAGSIVYVASGAVFSMTDGVTLANNRTTGIGAAIRNYGTTLLAGGTITGMTCDKGAVYSTGTLYVEGAPSVTNNVKTDGTTACNILLDESGVISITGALSTTLGFSCVSPAEGTVAATASDTSWFSQLTYEAEDGYTLDTSTGTLVASVTVTPTETPTETPTATPTATVTATPTTTATPTPTPTTAPKITCRAKEWTSATSIKLTIYTNVDGWYYADWVEADAEAPSFDTSVDGTVMTAENTFEVYYTDIPESTVPDLYICIKTSSGVVKTYIFDLSNYPDFLAERPSSGATSTPTPTPTHTPYIPDVSESTVTGLEDALEFYANTFYSFTVVGAGTTNTDPGEGDVKWVPLYWSTSSNPSDSQKHSTWKIGSTSGISEAATYDLYVFFEKYVYTDGAWVATGTVESAVYQFSSAAIDLTVTPTSTDSESSDSDDSTSDGTSDSDDTSSRSSVSTADDAPIGTMTALAAASLLAAGYILTRKRRKTEE